MYWVEVECAPGLENLVLKEVLQTCRRHLQPDRKGIEISPGTLRFAFTGILTKLINLKTAIAVYLVLTFDIPRPRALLGDQHFRRLLEGLQTVAALADRDEFNTLYISAAGRDSKVLTRLKDALAAATGLQVGTHEGDMLIRLRRQAAPSTGWETLLRLTPRPLATRDWRICNYQGALNASVAQVMVQLTRPRPEDIYLNLACGSGTLLVERGKSGKSALVIGCDISPAALACARKNLGAAHLLDQVSLLEGDGGTLPFAPGSIDVICGDLPFGGLVGSHTENLKLYPSFLKECSRVTRKNGRVALITHEIRLIRRLLAGSADWDIREEIQITLSGLHPCILLLIRL
jgi:23S rRNA G2445 N2-methylase RlmL